MFVRYLAFIAAVCIPCVRLSAQAPPSTPPQSQLSVTAIAAQAFALNPAARAAQQSLVEARARLAEAAAQRRLQPTLTGTLSGSSGEVAQPASSQTFITAEATISVPFPNTKRLTALRSQADAQVRAAQVALDRVRLDLQFRASDTYYGVLRGRGARDIALENLSQAERQVQDTQKRVDAGYLPPSDVLQAQVPVAQDRVALSRAQNVVRAAEQTINSLIMRDLSAPPDLAPMPVLAAMNLTRENAVRQALTRSPDVREAQDNVEAAEAALQVARHAHDPDYALQAVHTRSTDTTAYSSLTTIMVSATIPLGIGGIQRQQMKQAQAHLDQTKTALALAQQQTRLAAEQAYLDVESDQASVAGTAETVRIAQESVAKARQAFAAGLTTTRDVLDAQLALAQSRGDANAAIYDLAVSRAKLDQVTGQEARP